MKKKIIGNTILFIIILAYIMGFKFFFGAENILIAVTSVTGLLMFIGTDLTTEPVKNTFWLIAFNLLIGIGSFIAISNVWIAIPVNFFVMFAISYSFGFTLKNPMYLPFSLCYLFLLSSPVPLHALPLRLLALIFGALSIMVPQFFINKNKLQSASEKIFINLFELFSKKIELIEEGASLADIDNSINAQISSLKNIISDKKQKKFYLVDEGREKLDFLASLEKINKLLKNCDSKKHHSLLDDLHLFFNILNKPLSQYDTKAMASYISELKNNYNDCVDSNTIQIIGSILFLEYQISLIKNPSKASKKIKGSLLDDMYGLKNIRFNSIKVTYALRISICVVIACFLMQFFHLHEGRWIMFTVLSLTSPIFEITKSKSRDRIAGTILGAIIISILFMIFKNVVVRTMLLMVAGYISSYTTKYRDKITLVTVSAVGAAALISNIAILSFARIGFILVGVVIALLINSLLFKYDVEKANKNLFHISNQLITDLISNLDNLFSKDNLTHYINNIYLLSSQIDSSIKSNARISETCSHLTMYEKANTNKTLIILNAYEINKFLETYTLSKEDIDNFNVLIDLIKSKSKFFTKADEIKILSTFNSLSNKVIASSFIEINNNLNHLTPYIH